MVAGGVHGWGACMVVEGDGVHDCRGMHGCRGACVVARGCAWLQGGHAWLWGACMVVGVWVVVGVMHGCGGCAWLWGACMVVGGMHGCGGHTWLRGWGDRGDMLLIRQDTVNERAVRILLECILVTKQVNIGGCCPLLQQKYHVLFPNRSCHHFL